jgi:hypothetical protein
MKKDDNRKVSTEEYIASLMESNLCMIDTSVLLIGSFLKCLPDQLSEPPNGEVRSFEYLDHWDILSKGFSKDFYGKLDVVVVVFEGIYPSQVEDFFKTLSELLKENGNVIVLCKDTYDFCSILDEYFTCAQQHEIGNCCIDADEYRYLVIGDYPKNIIGEDYHLIYNEQQY